jgi:hypothetical protein
MPLLANIALFQIGWFACVLGAAHGLAWAGSAAALVIAGLHLAFAQRPRVELQLLGIAVALGFVWDSAVAAAGLIAFNGGGLLQLLAPHWMAALWLVFATTLNVSLRWLRGRAWLAVALGLVGGPLAYYAGAQLGALSFSNLAAGLAAQAIGWALLMPLLLRLAARFDGVAPRRFGEPVYV